MGPLREILHINEQWDELLRISASISNGTVSAVQVLDRFGSAAQGDPIYRAAKMLGRLLRTIYLCDYFTKPAFRREIHRVLNRGESVHTLHSVMMLRGGAKHCMVEGAKEQGDERECRNHSGPAA